MVVPVATSSEDVVVSGVSGRLPESGSVEEFSQQLFAGVDLVTADERRWPLGLWGLPQRSGKLKDLANFDAAFFGVPDKLADVMDPQLRLLLEVTHEAVVDAGLSPVELRGSRTGVYVAFDRSETFNAMSDDTSKINGYALTGCSNNMFSNRVSYSFDLKGPSISVDVACSGSMNALALAVNDMRAGRCDAAVVAGVNLTLDPTVSLNYHRLTMLSQDGRCAAFDASGRGFARSEAVVGVLLQRRCSARRAYCAVRGVGVSTDGYKPQGVHYPSGAAQRNLALQTFEEAGLRPQDVDYVEAHGSGTRVGDPVEVNAIADLFCKGRQEPLLLGAVKSNMGHAESASGLCSILKIVLAMETGVIPGNLHYKNPNADIPALSDGRIKVVDKNTPWQGGLVAVNSFGFGGTNAHAILEGGRGPRPPPSELHMPRLVVASGRTDDAVRRMLMLAAEHPRDAELHALMDAVHAHAIPGHPYRGYVVLGPEALEVRESASEPRPLWFVFSGMGSQWGGMARGLLRLPAFAASVARSAAALAPLGVDLQSMLAVGDLDDIVNCFVSITAVQVALVDVLFELGLRPDGVIGHSLGEIGCAYADGALSAEQAVLCAYWRGRCTRDAAPAPGAMAAVGLSWREAARRCPPDVEVACHNSPDSVTISGPSTSMEKFVEELAKDGLFVRMVNTAGVAFHSKHIAGVGPLLLARLQQLIPKPKPRSARWLSSSIPQDKWGSEQAKLSDAAYHVNNLLSPVRFAELLPLVPARALVVELAPHGLLQAVLKRALPGAVHVPLLRRGAPEPLVHLLAAVGEVDAAGAQPQVSRLYPTVRWPVSRGTPMLASRVVWDHSVQWRVADYTTRATPRSGENTVKYDVTKPEDAFIIDHNIDGRVIFPGTGYLTSVWRTLAEKNNLNWEEIAVVFENVNFRRATIVSCDAPLRFQISLSKTGEFEVCEGSEVVASGRVRQVADAASERLPSATLQDPEGPSGDQQILNSEDIYKELRLRGYNYKGEFRGIESSNAQATSGMVYWTGNWISFMDTVLQMALLGLDTRDLYLPTRIERIVIDPTAQRKAVHAAAGGTVPVKRFSSLDTVVSGGVEFRGMVWSSASRRINNTYTPKLEKCVFVPYKDASFEGAQSKMHALAAALQIVIENCGAVQIKMSEPALQHSSKELLLPRAIQVLQGELRVRAAGTLAAGARASRYAALRALGVEVSNKDVLDGGLGSGSHVVLGRGALHALESLAAASARFVLLEEHEGALERVLRVPAAAGLQLVSLARAGSQEYLLLQRATPAPAVQLVLEVHNHDYSWLEPLQRALKRAEHEDLRVYLWTRANCGAQGLAKCLQQEPGGARLRLYFLPDASDAFDPDAPIYRKQLLQDLAFNVLQDGVWGGFRHVQLDGISSTLNQVEHAYVSSETRGDLSSLRWVEHDLQPTTQRQQSDICRVYYAALNFRDVMIATGKLVPLASKGTVDKKDNYILGIEFSGRLCNGDRVMGIVTRGLATAVRTDPGFLWDVPEQWSLAEAATVPVAYATAYYALRVRARVRRGESVLVHSGAGGVGLAAIAVALHAGCAVFATVGSAEKRAFLRERFPQLPETHIGNSRDCSFEQLVLQRTGGRGVDAVLNSLTGDQLQASIRCLAVGGRFLEIGKADVRANMPLGMAALLDNVTVHGVMLDVLLDACIDHPEKAEIARCVSEGIAAGVVCPLAATIYATDQIEQAFRWEARGVRVLACTSDAGTPAGARTLLRRAASVAPVGGIFNLAVVLRDAAFENQTLENFQTVAKPKTDVSRALDLASRELAPELEHFVVFSSVSSGRGNPGQSNYGLANSGAERLCERRRGAGLPALAVQWGAVGDVGLLHARGSGEAGGTRAQPIASCLRALDALLPLPHAVVASMVLPDKRPRRRDHELNLVHAVANILGIRDLTKVSETATLLELGMDSLMGAEIKQTLERGELLLSVQEVRALTFGKLRGTDSGDALTFGKRRGTDSGDALTFGKLRGTDSGDVLTFGKLREHEDDGDVFGKLHGDTGNHLPENMGPIELIPREVLCTLPSQLATDQDDKTIFMVHGIEGTAALLRELAARARGTVRVLQCARDAPLADVPTLARFYVTRMRAAQPAPPYTLLGYSFGAAVAFEMALQLQVANCATRLVLLDGSPDFVAVHARNLMKQDGALRSDDAGLLAYLAHVFYDLNVTEVMYALGRLPDGEARLALAARMIGARVDIEELRAAACALSHRLLMGARYQPAGRLRAPVTLFTASENYVPLAADYGLRASCSGPLHVRALAGTHRGVLAGAAARTVADHVSALRAEH